MALQYLLPGSSTFEVAYVGNRGNNLQYTYALNQTPFGVDGSVAGNRAFPAVGWNYDGLHDREVLV
ncbi:MAG: hypothetical protein WDN31_05135 [Hyphomicrobium sp.]